MLSGALRHERDQAGVQDGVDARVADLVDAAPALGVHRAQLLRRDGVHAHPGGVEGEACGAVALQQRGHLRLDGDVGAGHDQPDPVGVHRRTTRNASLSCWATRASCSPASAEYQTAWRQPVARRSITIAPRPASIAEVGPDLLHLQQRGPASATAHDALVLRHVEHEDRGHRDTAGSQSAARSTISSALRASSFSNDGSRLRGDVAQRVDRQLGVEVLLRRDRAQRAGELDHVAVGIVGVDRLDGLVLDLHLDRPVAGVEAAAVLQQVLLGVDVDGEVAGVHEEVRARPGRTRRRRLRGRGLCTARARSSRRTRAGRRCRCRRRSG